MKKLINKLINKFSPKKVTINEVIEPLMQQMGKEFEKRQQLPNQYVVGYYRKKDDSLIGYHLDTFCTIGQDILQGKRYSGDNPYSQLEIIWKNLSSTIKDYPHTGMFSAPCNRSREQFGELNCKDIYIDVIYLVEGTPTQKFKFQIL